MSFELYKGHSIYAVHLPKLVTVNIPFVLRNSFLNLNTLHCEFTHTHTHTHTLFFQMWNLVIFLVYNSHFHLKHIAHILLPNPVIFLSDYVLPHCMITKMSINEYLGVFSISIANTTLIIILEDKSLHNHGIPSVEYRRKIVKSKDIFIFLYFSYLSLVSCFIKY